MLNKLKKQGILLLLATLLLITGCIEDTRREDYDYNISEVSGEGIIHLIKLANYWTNDILIIMLLLSLLTISYVSLKTVTNVKRSFAASSFMVMVVTFLVKMLDIDKNKEMMDIIVFASIIIFVFSATAMYFDREEVRY